MKSKHIFAYAAALCSVAGIHHLGHAQNQPTSDDFVELEAIIVQGSKTEVARQDFSTSLGYFGEERLSGEPIYNVEDIFDRTANAFTGTAGFGAYSLRGVNNNGLTVGLNASNALSTILVNQVALGLSSGDYIKPSLFDASSVEILRGPQSAIQGPNTLIGSIGIYYNRPEFSSLDGLFRAEYGEYDTYRLGLVQNIGIVDDKLAARVVVEKRYSEGDGLNTTTGREDISRTDEAMVRVALRYQPFEDDTATFDLTYTNVESDSNPFGIYIAPIGGSLFDRQQPYDVDDEYPADFQQITLESEWELSDVWTITSVTGYSDFEVLQNFDGDISAFPLLEVDGFITEELFSQEVRLLYTGDNLSGILGLYYSDGEYENGFSGDGNFFGMPFSTINAETESIEQTAIFGQVGWDFADDFNLTLGLRANREERVTDNFANNNGFVSESLADETFDVVIPSVSLSYDLNDQSTIGAKYSRGWHAGGIAFAAFLGVADPFDPEYLDNYEIFYRYTSEDGRLAIFANAYYADWTEMQVTFTIPGGVPGFDDLVENAGESSMMGVEIEIEYDITETLGSFLSIGYSDTEFEEFVLNGVDLAGRSFPNSPKYNFALGLNYEHENGFFATGTFSYVDDAYSDVSAPDNTELSARELLSSRIGYKAERWSVYVWGTNILDDDYELGVFNGDLFPALAPGQGYGRVGNPRTLGIGTEINW
ncbi:MAG: TonB-dependent receptor [Verrucomicrobiota bacterium]